MAKARPDLPPALASALDEALAVSLLERRITSGMMLRVLERCGLADPTDLRDKLEPLRTAAASLDGAVVSVCSFPPAQLSDVPPSSQPLSLDPESIDAPAISSDGPTQLMQRPELPPELRAETPRQMMRELQDHVGTVDHRPFLPRREIGPRLDHHLVRSVGDARAKIGCPDLVLEPHAPGEPVAFLGPGDVPRVEMVPQQSVF